EFRRVLFRSMNWEGFWRGKTSTTLGILREKEMKEFARCKSEANPIFPGYFALVMATGILSVGAFLLKHYIFAHLLFGLNTVMYILFWALTITKISYYPSIVKQELLSHQKRRAYFTMDAGTIV